MKKETHSKDYNLTPSEYIEQYHATNVYTMEINGKVEAIRLTCEQCPAVYAENHSYNTELGDYRLGQLLYHYTLIQLTKREKQVIFLGGGDYDYKRHYGSKELSVFDCTVVRNRLVRLFQQAKSDLREKKKRILKQK